MLKKFVNKLSLITLLLAFLTGCSTTVSFKQCGTQPFERSVAKVNTKRLAVKNVESILIRLETLNKLEKKDLECLLLAEYEAGKDQQAKIVTVHILENNVVFHFAFVYEENMLIEAQYVPIGGGVYAYLLSAIVPMDNVFKSFNKEKEDKLPIALVGQQSGIMPDEEFVRFMNELTNGNFSKTPKKD